MEVHNADYDDSFYSTTFGKGEIKSGNKFPTPTTLADITKQLKALQEKLRSLDTSTKYDDDDEDSESNSQTISECLEITTNVINKLTSFPKSPYDVLQIFQIPSLTFLSLSNPPKKSNRVVFP